MGLDRELPSLCNRIQIEITSALFVEFEVMAVNVALKRRLIDASARVNGKVYDAIHSDSATMQFRKMGKVQIMAGDVCTKLIPRRNQSNAARNGRIVDAGLQILELDLIVGEAQVAVHKWNSRAIRGRIANLNASVAMRVG